MCSNPTLDAYIKLSSAFKDSPFSIDQKEQIGTVILDQISIEQIITLSEAGLCSGAVEITSDDETFTTIDVVTLNDTHHGRTAKIELVTTSKKASYFIGLSLDHFLNYRDHLLKPIPEIYLITSNQYLSASSDHLIYNNYAEITQICSHIEEISDVTNGDDCIILFGSKLEIPFKLTEKDLSHPVNAGLLKVVFEKDDHLEAKKALLKELLVNFLADISKSLRLGYLITHFDAFSAQLLSSYQSYVSDYTFDKVRKEYQEKRSEFIAKINDSFNDVSAKLLALPAGLWIAFTQITPSSAQAVDAALQKAHQVLIFKNISALVVTLVLGVFVILTAVGQLSYLGSIKKEYTGLFDRLKSQFEDESNAINEEVASLDNRHTVVWGTLWLAIVCTVVVAIITVILFIQSI